MRGRGLMFHVKRQELRASCHLGTPGEELGRALSWPQAQQHYAGLIEHHRGTGRCLRRHVKY